jgi:hypothetical protein
MVAPSLGTPPSIPLVAISAVACGRNGRFGGWEAAGAQSTNQLLRCRGRRLDRSLRNATRPGAGRALWRWSPSRDGATTSSCGPDPRALSPARRRAMPCASPHVRGAPVRRLLHAGVGSGGCQSAPRADSVRAGPARDDQSSWVLRRRSGARARHIFTGAARAEGGRTTTVRRRSPITVPRCGKWSGPPSTRGSRTTKGAMR